ncbi:hypothetical protein ACIOD1_08095 [Streptomyces sp. NPDC088097]|uniref:hypothetical protein n=1 Tax=Streptomyces sp. NPDC088097 TaxID=3365823 RepID=UPI00380F1B64
MTLAELTFEHWRSLALADAERLAAEAALRVGGRVTLVDTVEHLGGPLHRVRIEREGTEFALVPGGTVRLGFDPDAWRPTPEQEADYADSLSQGFGFGPDLRAHLTAELSPVRTVTLATVLMAVEDEEATAPPEEMPTVLAGRGLRMPRADEWEHACGAGTRTLFRWGDTCPLDEDPYGTGGIRHEPNAFGLHIAYDSYRCELSAEGIALHGGDGGAGVCGGYGSVLAWLPLASAYRGHPKAVEALYAEAEDIGDCFSVRPVITLP